MRNGIMVASNSQPKMLGAVSKAVGLALGATAFVYPYAALAQGAADPASQAARASGAIEEVVVTAQFREQNLQETPLAITAISGADIEARGLTNVTEITASVPNINLMPAPAAFGNAMQSYIRGVGVGDSDFSSEPYVGVYIDDVYHSTVYGSVFDLMDLQRVEVARGPQGTLFGKNTIGGAIRLVSVKPQGSGEGYANLTYGSYDRLDLRAGMDLALVPDRLFMRLAGVMKGRSGHQTKIDFACAHPDQAGELTQIPGPNHPEKNCAVGSYGGENVRGARAALRWLPSDRLDVNLVADYMDDRSEVPANTIIYVDPTAPNLVRWNDTINIPVYGIPYDERFVPGSIYQTYATSYDLLNNRYVPEVATVEASGISLSVSYDLTDSLVLQSITAYREYSGSFGRDEDGSPLQIQNTYSNPEHDQVQQEVRLAGRAWRDQIDYTVGAFYFKSNSFTNGATQLQYIPLSFLNLDEFSTENKSVFAHFDGRITDRLGFVAGLRHTDETKSYFFRRPGNLELPEPREFDYSRWDWRAGLNFYFSDEVMLYGQVSTGYKSGGFNSRPFNLEQLVGYGPEEVTAYEIGLKSTFADRRVRLNVAAFHSDYDGRVVTVQDVDSSGLPFSRPANIGTAEIQGLEVELELAPTEGMLINLVLGTLDFESPQMPGRMTPGVPEHTASVGAQHQFRVGRAGATLTPRIDVQYRSEIFFDANNNPLSATPGRSVVNARLMWESPYADWSVGLAATNLTDKEYFVNKFNKLGIGQGLVEAQPARPREWALTVGRRF